MNILFLSNFYNHHQAFISHKLFDLTGGQYRFIATQRMPAERKKLGYKEQNEPFVYHYGVGKATPAAVQEWIDSADVVIVGSAPERLLATRKKNRKLIFRYSEHLLKRGFQWWKWPVRWFRFHKNNPGKASIYLLCASAYTQKDFKKFGLFRKRAYHWGYFPECKRYESEDALMAEKNPTEILWCGRFLDWKHPDDALTVAKRLREEGYSFHMNIIGTGNMEIQLIRTAFEQNLDECVTFLGSMSPEEVRSRMEQAGIYLFTSDHKEGWGAVLNEAMNSGCAVVACTAAGSTPCLIRNGKNGMSYSVGDTESLYQHVKYLLDHPEKQNELGRAAYRTVTGIWNADMAAERFLVLSEKILSGEADPNLFEDGPCSRM